MDDILMQEIQSLKEKLAICIKIVQYYEPDLDVNKFYHDIGTCDYQEYLHDVYTKEAKKDDLGSTEDNKYGLSKEEISHLLEWDGEL